MAVSSPHTLPPPLLHPLLSRDSSCACTTTTRGTRTEVGGPHPLPHAAVTCVAQRLRADELAVRPGPACPQLLHASEHAFVFSLEVDVTAQLRLLRLPSRLCLCLATSLAVVAVAVVVVMVVVVMVVVVAGDVVMAVVVVMDIVSPGTGSVA